MSLKILSGRKRGNSVWSHFKYDSVRNKSSCIISGGGANEGKLCGRLITGKNTTNLLNHIKYHHPSTYKEVCTAESDRKRCLEGDSAKIIKTELGKHASNISAVESTGRSVPIAECFKRKQHWAPGSTESMVRDRLLTEMIIMTGVPARIVQNQSFIAFCTAMDSRYKVPGTTRLTANLKSTADMYMTKVAAALSVARFVTIGMDIWTKKGYSASYLGISSSFFHRPLGKAVHVVLNLHTIQHPHTGEMIAEHLQRTLDSWKIDRRKILMVITDNGSNMVKAIKDFEKKHVTKESGALHSAASHIEDDEVDESSDEDDLDSEPIVLDLKMTDIDCTSSFKRLPCLAHTVQLIVKCLDKVPTFTTSMAKARGVVSSVRMSSVATQKLIELAGKTVISDCPTRWSSSFLLLGRLLELKTAINQVFLEMQWDNLVASEWTKLQEIFDLLEPFSIHTNNLQTDVLALPMIIPIIQDIHCHLDNPSLNSTMSNALKQAMKLRFQRYINPVDPEFDPLPGVACLLSPDIAAIMFTPDMDNLLIAAKKHIIVLMQPRTYDHEVPLSGDAQPIETAESTSSSSTAATSASSASLKRFTFLSHRINNIISQPISALANSTDDFKMELGRYIAECRYLKDLQQPALTFWIEREQVYPRLAPLAEDIVSAPASEAYCERVFSVCGELCSGKRNRMSVNLERRVFMKLNAPILESLSKL